MGTRVASDVLAGIRTAGDAVRARTRRVPEVGIVLGTGLGGFHDSLASEVVIPYADIPGFPESTVESHAGELHVGTLGGRPVAVMQGRVHYYEGYTMAQVGFPIRVLREIGCTTVVLTSACGGLKPELPVGSIVVATDHVNLMGDSPLIGPNPSELGQRFPDMSEPYSRSLVNLAERVAIEHGWVLPRVVFAGVVGPHLETAAEYRMLRWIGADVVGMSIVPETIVAVHGKQRVLAFHVVTDACLPDNLHPVDVPQILSVAAGAAPRLERLILDVVRRLDEAA